MRFSIQPEIFTAFDHPTIGVIVAHDLNNLGDNIEIDRLLRRAEDDTRAAFAKFASHGLHPNIAAWRQAYKKFGADPHQYRCSAESLVRRVLKGNAVPHVNNLVDLYNYISLKFVMPVGGEDIDAIQGNLRLAFADGAEEFIRLNGTENEPPTKGEVVYKDDKGVVCRRWNWREAERTKLTADTHNAVIVLDALAPVNHEVVEKATGELANLITQYCGGTTQEEIRSG